MIGGMEDMQARVDGCIRKWRQKGGRTVTGTGANTWNKRKITTQQVDKSI